jgi:hypothetical protein
MSRKISLVYKAAVAATVAVVLTGCVTGEAEYTPPSPRAPAPNSITIQRPLDDVWKMAIPRLGQRFFVINTIDRSSGCRTA